MFLTTSLALRSLAKRRRICFCNFNRQRFLALRFVGFLPLSFVSRFLRRSILRTHLSITLFVFVPNNSICPSGQYTVANFRTPGSIAQTECTSDTTRRFSSKGLIRFGTCK